VNTLEIPEFKYSDKKVDQLLIHRLYSHAYGTVFIHTVFGLLVTAILFSKVDSTLLGVWLGVLLANMLVRVTFIRIWLKASSVQREKQWMRSMALGTPLVSGVLWAISIVFLDFQTLPFESLALTVMVMALAASAALYSALFIPVFYLSVVPYVGSHLVYHLMQFSFESMIISIVLMVLGVMLYGQANRLHCMHKQSIIQTLKNEFLIANLQEANLKLEETSTTDFLTSVFNRRSFDQALNKAWDLHKKNQQPICLIMCDIDNFKDFNDTFGHQIGDEVLVRVANNIQQQIRPEDALFRYGGEEFAITLYNTTLDVALDIAERIRHNIMSDPIEIEGGHQFLTLSLGVSSQVPANEFSPGSLLNESDHMLFESKRNGRNRVTSVTSLG
jgi:diguanylate cyclase (GGDEF)-like protein